MFLGNLKGSGTLCPPRPHSRYIPKSRTIRVNHRWNFFAENTFNESNNPFYDMKHKGLKVIIFFRFFSYFFCESFIDCETFDFQYWACFNLCNRKFSSYCDRFRFLSVWAVFSFLFARVSVFVLKYFFLLKYFLIAALRQHVISLLNHYKFGSITILIKFVRKSTKFSPFKSQWNKNY